MRSDWIFEVAFLGFKRATSVQGIGAGRSSVKRFVSVMVLLPQTKWTLEPALVFVPTLFTLFGCRAMLGLRDLGISRGAAKQAVARP